MDVSSYPISNSAGWQGLRRYTPEPANRLSDIFQRVINGARSALSPVAAAIEYPQGDLLGLVNQQIEAQKEMQLITMMSNLERSRHETKMAAIRNLRVG